MALNLEQKKAIVSEVSRVATDATALVVADYQGISVPDMTQLRASAREKGVYLKVIRNTLARKALEGTEYTCVSDDLTGPMLYAFSGAEPSSAARLIKDFVKTNEAIEVKLVSIGGVKYPPQGIDKVAKLPTKDEAISMLMAVMKAPVEKLVRTMAEPQGKLVRTLAAVRQQKETSA